MRSPGYIGYLLMIIAVDILFLSATNIYRGTTFREAQFRRKYKGKIHAAVPISKHNTVRIEHCTDLCLASEACKSINVNEDITEDNCHLLGEDQNTQYNYIEKEGWSHYDTGRNQLMRLHHASNGYCLVPAFKSCTYSSSSSLVLASGSDCTEPYAWFRFDRHRGQILHMCTGTRICPSSFKASPGDIYFYANRCPYGGMKPVPMERWRRGFDYHISYFVPFCVNVLDATFTTGQSLKTYDDCNFGSNRYKMVGLGSDVKVSIYSGVGSTRDFNYCTKNTIKTHHSLWGITYLDSFDIMEKFRFYYNVMMMQAIFIAPESGDYVFYIGCDDWCRLFIGTNENEDSAYQIAYNDESVGLTVYDQRVSQKSSPINLVKDQKYYMEVLTRDLDGEAWTGVAMKAPSFKDRQQVTAKYLYPIGI